MTFEIVVAAVAISFSAVWLVRHRALLLHTWLRWPLLGYAFAGGVIVAIPLAKLDWDIFIHALAMTTGLFALLIHSITWQTNLASRVNAWVETHDTAIKGKNRLWTSARGLANRYYSSRTKKA